ncbi:MAG TPA: hypothetical protein VNL35_00275 [Chloroflexota bacterium]|nr:hypothetical protein [Chloroflexota bacterium]
MNQTPIDQAVPEVPIACTLGTEDRRHRGEEVAQLFLEGRPEARQLPDGYALRFPSDDLWASRLLVFIMGERACCPFFTFELLFEPGQGPIWLHLHGPAGTTGFVADLLARVEEHEGAQAYGYGSRIKHRRRG